ncbi:hypothetical protein GCM10022422_26400 [Flavobacterium ginsengisoli]|uniref:Uncharacterized protein n=1 Tax=Flavobacterium ginsengisoli TaxID=871694 RepID=A0ABP7FJG0_9FLAO|nr:hypothetical protein [Flavobacterium ginsengisoli]
MEIEEEKYRGRITPNKAQKMLSDEGKNVTLEEAEEILEFLQKIAYVQVRKFLNEKDEDM